MRRWASVACHDERCHRRCCYCRRCCRLRGLRWWPHPPSVMAACLHVHDQRERQSAHCSHRLQRAMRCWRAAMRRWASVACREHCCCRRCCRLRGLRWWPHPPAALEAWNVIRCQHLHERGSILSQPAAPAWICPARKCGRIQLLGPGALSRAHHQRSAAHACTAHPPSAPTRRGY
eukprot:SAG31_NODE_3060_length_4732_cov_2.919706_8_plen_176_part_00